MRRWVLGLGILLVALQANAGDFKWYHRVTKASDKTMAAAYARMTEAQALESKAVAGLTLERPGFKLSLESGVLGRETVELPGGTRACTFRGKAFVDFSVTEPMERAHMKRYTDADAWAHLPLEEVLVVSTGPAEPFGTEGFSAQPEAGLSSAELKGALRVDGLYTLSCLYNRESRDGRDVLVVFQTGNAIWCYRFDSENPEEMALLKLGRPPEADFWWWDPVVSLHLDPKGQPTIGNTAGEMAAKYRVDVTSTAVNLVIAGNGDVTKGSAALAVEVKKRGPALLLALNPMLGASRVASGDRALPFLQMDYSKMHSTEESGLLVLRPDAAAGPCALGVEYAGELLEPVAGGSFHSKEEDLWFPQMEDADGGTFDLTATVPGKTEVISLGDLVEKTETGDQTTWRYHFGDKTRFATFVAGKFRHHADTSEGVAVDVAFPESVWTAKVEGQEKSALVVAFNCLKIDAKLYGPPRYNKLSVGECSYGHGRGFPTLLLLSQLAPGGAAGPYRFEFDQALVSHELGHQWWGNQVRPLTYRDEWISEAMAELASLDYARVIYGPKKVKDALAASQFNLDGILAYTQKPAWIEGPILLGTRLHTTYEPRNAYQLIVYNKGAWAMINLRRIATAASPTGSEQPFYDAVQAFLRIYSGKPASTEDFRRIMEKRLGTDLGWFFDQYFRRTEIPSVTVKTRVDKDGAGWRLTAEGTQDTDFRLVIPIEVGQGEAARMLLFRLDGASGRQEFVLSEKPSSVQVDPYHETLARVKS